MKYPTRTKPFTLMLFAALALTASGQGLAALGDASAGQEKAQSLGCVSCHGREGISANPNYPNLAGQKDRYLLSQLKAFKKQQRKSPIMLTQAKGLSEEDMKDLVSYFNSLR
jgi:cytochrome c553